MALRIQPNSGSSVVTIEPTKHVPQKFAPLIVKTSVELPEEKLIGPQEEKVRLFIQEATAFTKKAEEIQMIEKWQEKFLSVREIDGPLSFDQRLDLESDLCLLHFNLQFIAGEGGREEMAGWGGLLEKLESIMQELLGEGVDIDELMIQYKKEIFDEPNIAFLDDLDRLEEAIENTYQKLDQEISEEAEFTLKELESLHQFNGEAIEEIYIAVDRLNTRLDHVQERMEAGLIQTVKDTSAKLKTVGGEAIAASEKLSTSLKKV